MLRVAGGTARFNTIHMGRLDPGSVELAKASASETLPTELMRLGEAGQQELAALYGATAETLVGALTDRYLEGLLNPMGNCKPKLAAGTPAPDGRMVSDLYWRCCVAMHTMPLTSLKALAKHHADLQQHLPPEDADEAVRRTGLVAVLLPRFSMACITEEEAEAAAKRREEIDAIKKEREKLEAEDAAAEEKATEGAAAGSQQTAGAEPAEEARGAGDGTLV